MYIDDKTFFRYEKLMAQAAAIKSEIDEIKDACLERGSVETRLFKMSVHERNQTKIVGLKQACKIMKYSRKQLESMGLLQTYHYQRVIVKRKKTTKKVPVASSVTADTLTK